MKIILALALCLASTTSLVGAERSFGIIGDAGKITNNAATVRASLRTDGTLDLIMPGDNLYSSSYTKVWTPWINDGFKFEVTAIGNHNSGYPQEVSFFKMPAEFFAKSYDGRTRFIVLNSDNTKTVKEQATFLETELKAAKEPFVFIVYHHPSYTLSKVHTWQEKKNFQLAVRPLLKKYRSRITGLLVGHDHLAMVAAFDDLPVIVSGAVQEVRKDKPRSDVQDGVAVNTLWYFDDKPFWAKLSIPETGSTVSVEYIRATDNLVRCTVTLSTGLPMSLGEDCATSNVTAR